MAVLDTRLFAAYNRVKIHNVSMKLTRPSRVVAALIALIGMLFMQLAVAAYACPELVTVPASEAAMTKVHAHADAMEADCIGSDTEQANLCNTHATSGNQSLDKPNVAPLSPFAVATLTVVLRDFEFVSTSPSRNVAAPPLTRVTAPPLAIRNCCFRI
jgi:hypothetical protein